MELIHGLFSYLESSNNCGPAIEGCVKVSESWMTWNGIEGPLIAALKIKGTTHITT
jgi:hypothetical protein